MNQFQNQSGKTECLLKHIYEVQKIKYIRKLINKMKIESTSNLQELAENESKKIKNDQMCPIIPKEKQNTNV